MKKLLLIATCLALVACNEMNGKLSVHEDLTLQGEKSEVVISAGEDKEAIIKVSRDVMTLKVDGEKIKFSIPEDSTIPSNNGSFKFSADEATRVKKIYKEIEGRS